MDTPLPKPSKKSRLFNLVLILAAFIGISLILTGWYLDYRKKILSFYITPVVSENSPEDSRTSIPVSIKIADSDVNVTIKETDISDGVWEIAEGSANYLKTSARPGGGGNVIIYGHNKDEIFGNIIDRSKVGQVIEIGTNGGGTHLYKIEAVEKVKPDYIETVLPTDYEVLTVYTCSGILNSERVVLKAVPI